MKAAPVAQPLYLDHPASTRPDEEVIAAMLPWLRDGHANPHAEHIHGRRAAAAVEQARAHVAALIGADPDEIVFTSGATESNNLALRGYWPTEAPRGVLALGTLEHKSLLETARDLAATGLSLRWLVPDTQGRLSADIVAAALTPAETAQPLLLSCGHANNELGVVQALPALADAVHAHGGHLHVDAAQSVGKIPFDVGALGADLVSVSSHKLYGPAGIGALYVTPAVRRRLRPQLTGGGQEGGLRSGTVPVFLAVGFGCAAALAAQRQREDALHLQILAQAFVSELCASGVAHRLLNPSDDGLPGLVSLQLPGIDAADLLDRLAPRLSVSTGAACNAGELRASHVMRAIGLSESGAREVLRVGFGRQNTIVQARWAAAQLAAAVAQVRLQE